ncbi:MAG: hypothetical protein M3388_11520 [Acidobacteriota bacterium]|nr:hypothetical protein [Acidobacteriota bacterium]
MSVEETKVTAEVGSSRELNKYLGEGWTLILSYVRYSSDNQQPRFVIGWQKDGEPIYPEMLDEWEINEIERSRSR